eukprot:NODE_762_length_4102_cov_1.465401.p2 type:complete len:209 gc:universal NODE_762_length_4102_cov_1.465401:565-1191(+)
MLTLIVEHFDEISDWSTVEYDHLSYHCKLNNVNFIITNYKGEINDAKCYSESIILMHKKLNFEAIILADLYGQTSLEAETKNHNPNENVAIIIGGMLGCDPPVDREGPLREIPGIICCSMTNLHLPTDVAGICAIKLMVNQLSMAQLENELVFPLNFNISKFEEHNLPFAYFKLESFAYPLSKSEFVATTNNSKIVFGKGLKSVIKNL